MKRKIKTKKIIFIIFFIVIIVIGILIYRDLHITNIYIIGNNVLKEYEVIENAGLEDYPKIIDINKKMIKEKLLSNVLINDVDIKVSLLGKVIITINENQILYKEKNNYMLSSSKLVSLSDNYIGVPELINSVDSEIQEKFVNKMILIDRDVLQKISEIEYKPSFI